MSISYLNKFDAVKKVSEVTELYLKEPVSVESPVNNEVAISLFSSKFKVSKILART